MFAQIRCSNPRHGGRSRAGRRFENGVTYRMEILERPLKDSERDQHGNGPLEPGGAVSMEAIDRASLNRVKADPTMSVLEGGETDSQLSQAAFDELRKQLRFASEQLTDAKIAFADTDAHIKDLETKLAASEARVKDLETKLAAPPAKDETKPEDDGKPGAKPKK